MNPVMFSSILIVVGGLVAAIFILRFSGGGAERDRLKTLKARPSGASGVLESGGDAGILLEDEGLVESRHGIGTLVTDVDMALMAQVYDLRLHLSALVGQLDPLPVTAGVMAEIREFVTRGEALLAAPDPRAFAALNSAYHHFGLSLTGNAPLRETAARLYYLTARIWLTSIPRMNLTSECAIFLGEMRETETALAAGDTAAAALIRRAHISMSVHRMTR